MKIDGPVRIRNGDLFAIRLADRAYAIGIVLNSSRLFKMAMLISIYDRLFDSVDDFNINMLPSEMLIGEDLPNYTGKAVLTKGFWQYLGNFPDLSERIEQSVYQMGNTLYKGDTELSERPDEEIKTWAGHGYKSIEHLVKRHFGLP